MCLIFLLLAACSSEPERPDRGEISARTTVADAAAGSGPTPVEAGASGYVEYTVEGVLLRRDESTLNIEEARIQRTEGRAATAAVVRVEIERPADYERCLLMRESTWLDLERSFEDGDLSDKQVFEHPWGRRTLREEFDVGNETVVVFSESPGPDAGPTDVSELPLYALCYTNAVSSSTGGARRTTYYDVAHVEGTLKTSREP